MAIVSDFIIYASITIIQTLSPKRLAPMAPTLPQFNPAKLRSYILRLPLFTRLILLLILVFWVLKLQSAWDVTQWGALIPKEVNLGTSKINRLMDHSKGQRRWNRPSWVSETDQQPVVYRLNTYPLIHQNFFHAFFNVLALVPLLERFEAEHGTLLTGAMFAGRVSFWSSP